MFYTFEIDWLHVLQFYIEDKGSHHDREDFDTLNDIVDSLTNQEHD